MDFKQINFPRFFFPRFDHASEKSLELQSRYCILVGKDIYAKLPENKCVNIYFGKNSDDLAYPIDRDDFIVNGTYDLESVQVIKSRSVSTFLNVKRHDIDDSSILIVDSKYNQAILKLGATKLHFVLIAKDEREKENVCNEISVLYNLRISVTLKENVFNTVNNLLERTALKPLKEMANSCFDMLQKRAHALDLLQNVTNETSAATSKSQPKIKIKKVGLPCSKVLSADNCMTDLNSSDLQPSKIRLEIDDKQSSRILRPIHSIKAKSLISKNLPPECLRKPVHKSLDHGLDCDANLISQSSSERTNVSTRAKSYKRLIKSNGLAEDISTFCNGVVCQRSLKASSGKAKKRKTDHAELLIASKANDHDKTSTDTTTEENPERLLEAILALYSSSNVPEAEKPNVPERNCTVNKEMRNEIFKISPSIKRFGFRYRQFCVYVVKPKSCTDEKIRNEQIRSVLKKYGIFMFEIVPCAANMLPFTHVGAKIQAKSEPFISLRSRKVSRPDIVKGGTLGCFAKIGDSNMKYGLLSKHVTEGCMDIFHVGNGNNKRIGYMLNDTNKHKQGGLDISAAFIEEHIDENGTRFKDTRQNHLKGTLYEYEGGDAKICRSGQSVHIYGACSNPGKGEITMTSVDSIGLSSPLIQVEDKINRHGKVDQPFAVEGDSGSIVCVEDPDRKTVHAVSMVIGTQDLTNSAERRTYLTLPLSKGLQQLEHETNSHFNLC